MRRRQRRSEALAHSHNYVIYAAGFVVLVVVIVASSSLFDASSSSILVLLVAASGFLALLPFLVGIRHFDIFEPIYLYAFSYFILFVVRPAAELANPTGLPLDVGYDPTPTYGLAMVVGIVGTCCFYLGYYLPAGKAIGHHYPMPRTQWNSGQLGAYVACIVIAASMAFTIFIATSGGIPVLVALLSGRNAVGGSALQQSSGYLYTAPLWLAPVGVLLLALSARWRSAQAVAGLGLILLSQIIALALGDRSWTLPVAGAVVAVAFLKNGRRPSALFVLSASVIVLLLGVSVPRDYRNTAGRTTSFTGSVAASIAHPQDALTTLFTQSDTAMLDDLAIELQFVPSSLPYTDGATYLEALTRPVPRQLWSAKPPAADTQLMATIWPDFARAQVGFAFSIFGEPYLNLGIVGVALFSLLFGAAWRSLYAWFLRDPMNRTMIAVYALSWPFLAVYIRGGLGVDYQRQIICVAPVLLALAFGRRRSASGASKKLSSRTAVP